MDGMGWDGSPGGPRYRAPTVLIMMLIVIIVIMINRCITRQPLTTLSSSPSPTYFQLWFRFLLNEFGLLYMVIKS